ncbi:MAG: ABC transporter substrate-binding protein, partial [Syntrophaceae bacterium]|nr:ABC transporter substrate-binding protein [Syntrophaceae bacterium]
MAVLQPEHGGTLKIVDVVPPHVFGYPPEMRGMDFRYSCPCLQRLITFDEAGKRIPELAESWKDDPEGMGVLLHLRKGVKFHDGTDFDAEAVRWNMQIYIDGKHSNYECIERMEVVDRHTLRVKLNSSPTWFIANCGGASGGFIISPTAFAVHGLEWCRTNPIGTGPFRFDSYQAGTYLKYVRFDGYWGDRAYLDAVELRMVKDLKVAAGMLESGEADIGRTFPTENVAELQKKGFTVRASHGIRCRYLTPSTVNEGSSVANKIVREAFEYAIDREAIAKTLDVGTGLVIPVYQYPAPGTVGYRENYGRKYDPSKARALLAEAGYPDGVEITATLQNDPDWVAIGSALQGYCAAVGIRLKIKYCPRAEVEDMDFLKGWDGYLSCLAMIYAEEQTVIRYAFKCPPPGAVRGKDSLHLCSMKRPDAFCVYLEESSMVMTAEGHHQAFEKAAGVMCDELMWTPISGIKDSCVVAHRVQDC